MESDVVIEIPTNGSRNAQVRASGVLVKNFIPCVLVLFDDLKFQDRPTKKLKIQSLTFAIQEKAGFLLWWRVGETLRAILPLESRGYLNWEAIHAIHSPEGADAIMFESFGVNDPKMFTFTMDMEKQ